MRISISRKNHAKVYDILVKKLGFGQDIFLTDDVLEISKEEYEKVAEALKDIPFVIMDLLR